MINKIKFRRDKLWYYLIAIYSATLAYGSAIPNLLSGVILFFWFFELFTGKIKFNTRRIGIISILLGYYLFQIISLAWSSNLQYWLDKIGLQIFIPIFCVVLSSVNISKRELIKVQEIYILSITVLFVISFFMSLDISNININSFIQSSLSESFVDIHFLAFSLYVSLAIVFLVELILNSQNRASNWFKKLFFLFFILLFTSLVLLSSRTTIFLTIGIVLIQIIRSYLQTKNLKSFISIGSVLIFTFFLIAQNKNLVTKIEEAINYKRKYNVSEYWGGRGLRELIWNCSLHIIKENPIIGVGFGDQQDELTLCYRKYRYGQLLFTKQQFNAHNLFLQVILSSGIIGFLLFVISFLYPQILLIKMKDWTYFYFIIVFFGTGLTESHLNRNAGITLFAFFNPLIIFTTLNKNESTSDS